MKETQLTEAFCEVLAGLALLLLAVPLLDISHVLPLETFFTAVLQNLRLATLGSILIVAYLMGAIFDAVGMATDELLLAHLLSVNPLTEAERKKFWCDVKEHVLRYRDCQWAWYSCYRNLLIILFPTAILWIWDIVLRSSMLWGAVAAMGFGLLGLAFVSTMKTLLKIYSQITKGV
jgi:hypothetical protein